MLPTSRLPAAFTHHLRKSCRFAMVLPYPYHKPPLALPPPRALATLRYILFGCRFSVQSEVVVLSGTKRVPHRRRRVTHHARLCLRAPRIRRLPDCMQCSRICSRLELVMRLRVVASS